MNHHDAFLAAIRDDPEDLPRLAYADWLDENGDLPRAAFIRAQIDRARLPWDDDRQGELQAAERRLLIEHGLDWLPSEMPMESVRFRRGFVEEVGGNPRQLRERFPLWKDWPVRRLAIESDDSEDADWFREQPWLARIASLKIDTTGPNWPVVLESPHLTGLREVAFQGIIAADSLLASLERGLLHEQLEALDVGGQAGADDLDLLSLSWPRLRRVKLGHHHLSGQAMRQLLYSGLWTRLDEIDMDQTTTDGVERAVLVRGLECTRANRLALPSFEADVDVLGALADAGRWGRLSALSIIHRGKERRSLERFLAHPGVARLIRLDLNASVLDLMPLADCDALSGLRWLTMPHNPNGFAPLALSPHLTNLRGVGGQGAEDCRAYLLSPKASHLRWLSVAHLKDPVITALAESPHLRRLATLRGNVSTYSPAAARAVAEAPGLPSLSWVKFGIFNEADLGRTFLAAQRLAWVDLHSSGYVWKELASLLEARYRGVNWGHCLDER